MTSPIIMSKNELANWAQEVHTKLRELAELEPSNALTTHLVLFEEGKEKTREHQAALAKYKLQFPADPDLPDDQIVSLMSAIEDALEFYHDRTHEPSVTGAELAHAE
jgi:hypothetical protein